jgi:hypothetical protein
VGRDGAGRTVIRLAVDAWVPREAQQARAPAGTISAGTFGSGRGGTLDLDAAEALVDNGVISAGTSVMSTGPGGDIDLTADRIVLRNTGSIEA